MRAAAFCMAGGLALVCASPVRSALPSEPPNVLLIITDQQRADMLSCAGNPYVKTPAMDSLAAAGVRFEMAYCANPVCAPSRMSMMSGVMPSRIGMDRNMDFPNDRVGAEIRQNALGAVFRRAGYETIYGGKSHLAAGSRAYGFDTYLTADEREGLAQRCAEFFRRPHDRPFLLVASFINPHDICYMAVDAEAAAHGTRPEAVAGPAERAALDEALRLPQGVSREDFFRRLCPPLPSNFEIPQGEPPAARQTDWRPFRQYVQDHWTADEWRLHRWAYARLTERADRQIGTMLAALRAAGLDESTLIVFTSDHGEMDGSHKLEHKSMPYEEALRVPLILSRKGATPPGRVDKTHLVSTGLDLIPTLCDFAGIAVPPALKGRSVKPLITAQDRGQEWRGFLAIENERSRILRTERFKYAVYDRGQPREMLVDLQTDPGEMHNLAANPEYHEALLRHRALLREWYQRNNETLGTEFIVSGHE
jgi:arylsulfatase A-like enzyme